MSNHIKTELIDIDGVMTKVPMRVVVCAANYYNGTMVLGARHFDQVMHTTICKLNSRCLPDNPSMWRQGFIDQYGLFMDRKEALQVATKAGQLNVFRTKTIPMDELFSDDLY